jgi:predicted RNase H-like nuclease (RuvC/YqgF family)
LESLKLNSLLDQKTTEEICKDCLEISKQINHIEQIQQSVIKRHQADFLEDYRLHMLKVQKELTEFKHKASDYYQMLKKDERIQQLDQLVEWFKSESVRLAANIESLQRSNTELGVKLKESSVEIEVWRQKALQQKAYNRILKDTIEKLKSKELIEKYE